MAIQIPNPGTGVPADQTGDSPWLAMKKVADNFSNSSHAASRLVGTGTGQVPLAQDALKAVNKTFADFRKSGDCNNLTPSDGKIYTTTDYMSNLPSGYGSFWFIETLEHSFESRHLAQGIYRQVATSSAQGGIIERYIRTKSYEGVWREWKPEITSRDAYLTTTASGANVVVDNIGKFMRSTSSERYKDILSNVVLDDEMYNRAINEIQPIVYRSTADADNAKYHYYSFSAEKVGAFDPALALWRETETVTDDDGNTTERKLDERQAEGLNINGILALQYAMITYQHNKQVELEARILKLEQANEV